MNIIIKLLYRNFTKKDPFKEAKYLEIFKVGDGMLGTTIGINCTILDLDQNNGMIIFDMQGNNDIGEVERWKFLYYSLFFFAYLMSDYHFYFYEGTNVNEITQNDLLAIIDKKEKLMEKDKDNWTNHTELILINNKLLIGEKRKAEMQAAHLKKAKQVYSQKAFKEKIFFISKNEHFNTLEDEICLKNRTFVINA